MLLYMHSMGKMSLMSDVLINLPASGYAGCLTDAWPVKASEDLLLCLTPF